MGSLNPYENLPAEAWDDFARREIERGLLVNKNPELGNKNPDSENESPESENASE